MSALSGAASAPCHFASRAQKARLDDPHYRYNDHKLQRGQNVLDQRCALHYFVQDSVEALINYFSTGEISFLAVQMNPIELL